MAASDPQAGTLALDPAYLETITHHHREYQQYAIDHDIYFAPTDEDEINRLHIQHEVLCKTFDNRLLFPPLEHPRRILDCGYGTASWAVAVAEQFPQCEVVGVDINPLMKPDEEEIPQNLYLQLDNLNRRFNFQNNYFDLVHSQLVAGGINATRWPSYLRDIFKVTKAGGWCQMVELYFQCQSDNGTLSENHALRQWSARYFESMAGMKDLRIPLRLQNAMREAGFVDVEQRMLPLHTCGWSNSTRENEIGVANRDNVHQFLSSLAVYPFTERLGMTLAEVQLLVAHARIEAEHEGFRAYFPLYVCIGRKPRK